MAAYVRSAPAPMRWRLPDCSSCPRAAFLGRAAPSSLIGAGAAALCFLASSEQFRGTRSRTGGEAGIRELNDPSPFGPV